MQVKFEVGNVAIYVSCSWPRYSLEWTLLPAFSISQDTPVQVHVKTVMKQHPEYYQMSSRVLPCIYDDQPASPQTINLGI